MPAAEHALKDILDTVAEAGSFKIFCSALKAAGLVGTLRGSGPFTVFAPTDDAFGKLAESTLQDWLRPQSKAKLKEILTYHMLPGQLMATEMVKSSSVKTVQGTGVTIRFKNNRIHVNHAMVLQTDVACDNGVIHVLDTVVVPR